MNRQTSLMLLAIVGGSLAAGLLWQQFHRTAPNLSDQQAQKLGFADENDHGAARATLAQAMKAGTLTQAEWARAKNAILHGSQSTAEYNIEALGYLKGQEQAAKAIDLLNQVGVDAHTRPFWLMTLKKLFHTDGSIRSLLLASPNPSVKELTKELGDDK